MRRRFGLTLAAALSACAPAPVQMPAAQASEVLNLFASGRGPASICSDDGRALLRGAVRAYAREMDRSGVAWPAVPGVSGEAENVTHVDLSVMVAYAAGFVKTSDFQQPVRGFLTGLTFAELPDILSLRRAARFACEDVEALQRASARFVMEQTRMGDMVRSAERHSTGRETADRLRRQSDRVNRAREEMQEMAAIVQTRMAEHGL